MLITLIKNLYENRICNLQLKIRRLIRLSRQFLVLSRFPIQLFLPTARFPPVVPLVSCLLYDIVYDILSLLLVIQLCKETGLLMPADFARVAEQIYNLEVREDDIWVVTFPKCGTTWTQVSFNIFKYT